ncbi:LysR substrate-binding domain-containing protein [Rhodobacteraceae bacterium R_SAG6]|uniref:LysR family transcriptional regulator n=1 Tax=Tritonibacter mobilis TaxID=379347 RepID=UPI0014464E08|nr:LysR family transcriptional regulator [Rhodobacteraceae bacterium G21628-S1]NKX29397.1 LysR family transcriptional regulator [Rhodobacteraceae bacterium R_SAG6]
METETLRLFVTAAERLNISAAGRSLGLAPAMASARLAKLEHELGSELLHRTTRKVSLSQEGAAFLPYAKEILAQSEAARAALGLNADRPSGTLRFAAPSSFAQLHIMPLLPAFHAQYPDITLDLRLSDVRMDLIEGSFDLALRSAPLKDSSLRGRKLGDDTRVLCAAPAYLARRGTPITPEDLDGHDLLSWASVAPRDLVAETRRFSLDPARMICRTILDDGTSQRIATMAGGGVSINSLWSVAHEIRAGRLVHLLPDWRLDDASVLWLIYPRSNVLTPKVRVFIDFLLAKLTPAPWQL